MAKLSRALPADDRKILYVEDEDSNWAVAEFGLSGKFELVRAKNAREAFEHIARGGFRLILMDIQLHGSELNGIDITRILKGRHAGDVPDYARGITCPDTPMIFVTAYGDQYNREELLGAGAEEVIPKPVDFPHLIVAISRLLARRAVSVATT